MRTYERAKAEQEALEAEYRLASQELKAVNGIGSGTMGLTPEHVKATPEYQERKARYDAAFARLRNFNATFTKQFAKEIKEDRQYK